MSRSRAKCFYEFSQNSKVLKKYPNLRELLSLEIQEIKDQRLEQHKEEDEEIMKSILTYMELYLIKSEAEQATYSN